MTRFTVLENFSLFEVGNRVTLPCANLMEASVQVVLSEGGTYGSGVLTIKGTLDGVDWQDLGEPTITADALRGPLYVRGLHSICVEVTTPSTSLRRARIVWSAAECGA